MSGNQAAPTPSGGWKLVAVAALVATAVIELELLRGGRGESGWRGAVQATAATSLLLFLLVYLASTLHRLWRGPATLWLLRNRRYLGVSFALTHFAHFGSIVALARTTGASPPLHLAVLGGLGDLLLLAMIATSFDRSAAWLGARRWNLLHRVGIHYVWAIFAFTYAGAASAGRRIFPLVAVAALLLALGARLGVRLRQRSPLAPAYRENPPT